jgi:hypothetical protein
LKEHGKDRRIAQRGWIGFNGGRRLAQVALGTAAEHCEVRDLAAQCGAGRICMAC